MEIGCILRYTRPAMTTPQDSPRRKKQKIRRAKQLAQWREKQEAKKSTEKK